MVVWIGSMISVVGAMAVAFMAPDFVESWLVIATGFVYLLGGSRTYGFHSPAAEQTVPTRQCR